MPNEQDLWFNRIATVVIAMALIMALSIGTDVVMHVCGFFPAVGMPIDDDRLYLLASAYRGIFAIIGSYVAASLAPDHPMRHALIPGFIALSLDIFGATAMPDANPAWYIVGLAVASLPCAWIGGKLHERACDQRAMILS